MSVQGVAALPREGEQERERVWKVVGGARMGGMAGELREGISDEGGV
jgi:hypothetical protein